MSDEPRPTGTGAHHPPRPRAVIRSLGAALLALTAGAGCTAPDGAEPPGGPDGAAELALAAERAASHCVAVSRDGEVVLDERFGTGSEGMVHPAHSVTKAVASVLVGIAQDDGDLSIDDPAAVHLPEWRESGSAEVTIRHLLAGTSGREWDPRSDYGEMALRADDKTALALARGQDTPPGERWTYDNSAVQSLEAVLERATGRPVDEFARDRLFEPLGMRDTALATDDAGNTLLFAGMRTTCPDLLALGTLLLDGGLHGGERIVSSEYLRQATGGAASPHNAAYGLLFWVNAPGPAVTPGTATDAGRPTPVDGPLVPAAPETTFWALGLHEQILAVVPEERLVAVRLGVEPPAGRSFSVRAFTELALAAE